MVWVRTDLNLGTNWLKLEYELSPFGYEMTVGMKQLNTLVSKAKKSKVKLVLYKISPTSRVWSILKYFLRNLNNCDQRIKIFHLQLLYIDDQAPFSSTATVEEINYYTCLIPDLIGEHKNGFHNHILEYHSILSEETFYFLLNLISMRW